MIHIPHPGGAKIISIFHSQTPSNNAENPDTQEPLKDTLVSRILPEDYEVLYSNLGYRFYNNALPSTGPDTSLIYE